MRILGIRFKFTTPLLALALIGGAALLSLSQGPGVASADSGTADVTFTKWVTQATAFPWDMKGVVGGDVGTGTFTGEVLSLVDDGTTTKIHALYHFNGAKQSLTADLQVTQTDATGAAVLSGAVTVGYLKGSQVAGEYKTLTTCDIPTPGNVLATVTPVANPCFKGTLHTTAAPATAPTASPTIAPTLAPTPAPTLAPKPPATGNSGIANRGGGTSQPVVWLVGIATAGLVLAGRRRLVSRRSAH
jgi:hypothetical protein